jgi:hypothetical protein
VRLHLHKVKLLAGMVLVLSLTLQTAGASAQDASDPVGPGEKVKGNVAGTVGLGLLGAELGLILTPTVGLQDHWWAWTLFPTLGAAGGVLAGVFAFDEGDPGPKVTASLLGAGLALALPAVVGAVAIRDRRRHGSMERIEGGGVIRVGARGTRVGVPDVGTAPVYTVAEQTRFGVAQRSAVRISLVSGRF